MFKRFLFLEWKSFLRSASFSKNLAVKILLAFSAIYFIIIFFSLGIGLYPLLKEAFPEQKPMLIVNMFVVYWFLAEFFVRFMWQSLPIINVKPLLINNINKKRIIRFLLTKTLFSPFNFFTPLLIFPFGVWNIYVGDYSLVSILCWWIAILSLMFSANFLNFLLNRYFSDNIKKLFPYVAIVLILVGLERFDIFKTSHFIGNLMDILLEQFYFVVIPIALCLLTYKLIFNHLRKSFYLDNVLKSKNKTVSTADFGWVRLFGDIAPFLQLDLKLIWRNKRSKSVIWTMVFFVFYGLLFYPNPEIGKSFLFSIFIGIFLSGVFLINFGQFIPAWDSTYYSMLMAQNIPMKQYVKSKAYLIYGSILLLTLLTIPYVYFGKHILLVNLATALYNLGLNVPILLYMDAFNKKRIDLDKSSMMNYQGTGIVQWLLALPFLVLPILIGWLCELLLNEIWATVILAGLGFVGFLCREYFFELIANKYKSRKYITINGFKQQL
ncbi:DUF5687 family protein [Capnocytophaga canis]|uniref:DUF5687 family protein n=1 Tax=Capnocytophaga canis TaxID=1848903 RepID=UPI00385D3CE4